ncbi:MAG: class I SAM-dependent methyltransferase [Deltaproteobacteria bacterium]|nr:class I SAM-dependent methyltransferase [Deltaproteobacteria bacterium]
MNHIRPHKVFNLLGEEDRMARINLPFQHSVTSMLERAILASLLKVIAPRTIFEFGTYLGETTLMFAENSSAQIFTLDLGAACDSELLDGYEQKNLGQSLCQKKLFDDASHRERIVELFGDSTQFDFAPYREAMDFILIDGGHHMQVVRSDTENAFCMITKDRPACIVWHDYRNPNYQITEYLDELSDAIPLFHVEETKYVFSFHNGATLSGLRS